MHSNDTGRRKSVFVGNPTYNGMNAASVTTSIINASRTMDVTKADFAGSVTHENFNKLFVEAVLGRHDYFAMIHADICAEDLWVDKLVEILEAEDAELVSACIALKNDDLRAVSTGYNAPTGGKCLSFDDLAKLPVTFGLADIQTLHPEAVVMLVNTGLWVCRLRDEGYDPVTAPDWRHGLRWWIPKWQGFTMMGRILWDRDTPEIQSSSEDFIMSYHLAKQDPAPKILATRAVAVRHLGVKWYGVDVP